MLNSNTLMLPPMPKHRSLCTNTLPQNAITRGNMSSQSVRNTAVPYPLPFPIPPSAPKMISSASCSIFRGGRRLSSLGLHLPHSSLDRAESNTSSRRRRTQRPRSQRRRRKRDCDICPNRTCGPSHGEQTARISDRSHLRRNNRRSCNSSPGCDLWLWFRLGPCVRLSYRQDMCGEEEQTCEQTPGMQDVSSHGVREGGRDRNSLGGIVPVPQLRTGSAREPAARAFLARLLCGYDVIDWGCRRCARMRMRRRIRDRVGVPAAGPLKYHAAGLFLQGASDRICFASSGILRW